MHKDKAIRKAERPATSNKMMATTRPKDGDISKDSSKKV